MMAVVTVRSVSTPSYEATEVVRCWAVTLNVKLPQERCLKFKHPVVVDGVLPYNKYRKLVALLANHTRSLTGYQLFLNSITMARL